MPDTKADDLGLLLLRYACGLMLLRRFFPVYHWRPRVCGYRRCCFCHDFVNFRADGKPHRDIMVLRFEYWNELPGAVLITSVNNRTMSLSLAFRVVVQFHHPAMFAAITLSVLPRHICAVQPPGGKQHGAGASGLKLLL